MHTPQKAAGEGLMKLCFLGTGTAGSKLMPEGTVPEGKRRCCSMWIDGDVVVDLSMQSFDYATKLGMDTAGITDIFLSHTHRDHYCKATLLAYAAAAKTKIHFWCHRDSLTRIGLTEEEAAMLNVHPIEVGDEWETAGMKVKALRANHLTPGGGQPLHYIFERNGQKLFYGCDGAWFCADTWEYMRANGELDIMILEATVGDYPGNFRIGTHNTVPMLRLMLAAIHENGILKEGGTLIADHIGGVIHDEKMAALLSELGMIEAYDGLTIEV